MTIKQSILAGIAVLSLAVVAPVGVYAHEGHTHSTQSDTQEHQTTARQVAQETVAEKREMAQAKLTEVKLRACQNRQKAVAGIMTRITERAQKQVNLFSTIADRTKSFYEDRGKTLTNYDVLVADVDAKKANAQSLIDSTKATASTFDCNGEDPKGVVNSFKLSAETTRGALQEYRTAVKNLIVGVKSVQGTTSSEDGAKNETAQ